MVVAFISVAVVQGGVRVKKYHKCRVEKWRVHKPWRDITNTSRPLINKCVW